jgi:hypothetical protein
VAINRWWDGRPAERYWVEITDRPDIGADLKAPKTTDQGSETWGYSLTVEPQADDIVLHYSTPRMEIVGFSRTTGVVQDIELSWAPRSASGRRLDEPIPRPAWRHLLRGYRELHPPVTLAHVRASEREVRLVLQRLRQSARGALYFPFALSDLRSIRTAQTYLAKFPAGLVEIFPTLSEELAWVEIPMAQTAAGAIDAGPSLGRPYITADETTTTIEWEPFSVDPSLVDRGTRGHALTQNALSAAVRRAGHEVLSPGPHDPRFDLAWRAGDRVYVCEVKSLTSNNEERQLRLGLGQVLRYRDLLALRFPSVKAVLAVEREPSDESWSRLCNSHDVALVWPARFDQVASQS